MDIELLKEKYKDKSTAGVEDLHIVLDAVPFLVKEVIILEEKLKNAEIRIKELELKCRTRLPQTLKGKKNKALWEVRIDEKKNRLFIILSGAFDYYGAKEASNAVLSVSARLKMNFDVICDISGVISLEGAGPKVVFQMRKVFYNLKPIGLRKVVWVVKSKDKLQKVICEKVVLNEYKILMVNTISNAELMLNSA